MSVALMDRSVSAVLILRASAKAVTPLFSMLVVLMNSSVSAVLILRASAKAVTPVAPMLCLLAVSRDSVVSAVLILRASAKAVTPLSQSIPRLVLMYSSVSAVLFLRDSAKVVAHRSMLQWCSFREVVSVSGKTSSLSQYRSGAGVGTVGSHIMNPSASLTSTAMKITRLNMTAAVGDDNAVPPPLCEDLLID